MLFKMLKQMVLPLAVMTTILGGSSTVIAQEAGTVRGRVTIMENGDPVHGAVVLIVGPGLVELTDDEVARLGAGANPWSVQPDKIRRYVPLVTAESPSRDFASGSCGSTSHIWRLNIR